MTAARASTKALEYRLAIVKAEYAAITIHSQSLNTMLLQLMKGIQPAIKAKTEAENMGAKLDKTLRLPELTFLNVAEAGFSRPFKFLCN